MMKIKLLVGLGAAFAVMAMSVAPAGAWFQSLNGTSQGQVKIVSKTTLVAGGAKVSCATAEGEWHLQTKGQFKQHEKEEKQVKTLLGPHLYVKISKWNNCEAEVALEKVKGVTVSACEFQIEQNEKGATVGTGTVITACVIKVPLKTGACVITVFAANESTGLNDFLNKVEAESSGKNVLGTAEVTGIRGEATCLAEKEFVKGEFKSLKGGLIAEELNLA